MNIIRRGVGDAVVVDDLYQETFCIVLKRSEGRYSRAGETPWFVAVGPKTVIKYFQRAAQQEF